MSDLKVPTMAEFAARGEMPDVLFWVGCAGFIPLKAMSWSALPITSHACPKDKKTFTT
jgi:hypothetical protein